MKRTVIVTGSASGLGSAVAEKLRDLGDRVIGVDFSHAEVTADLSTVAGRLEGAEKALELSGGTIHSIVACAEFNVPKPVAISVNFFGVTHFVEALSDILTENRHTSVITFTDTQKEIPVCENLVSAMLAGDEPRALFLGQNLADVSLEQGQLNYTSSKRALHTWIDTQRDHKQWAGAGISLHSIDRSTWRNHHNMADLLEVVVSLTHPMPYAV
jgi:NAD(P)-dependent dehydrogenase (short-subunit alcohol dehydrogenase family)